MEKVRDKNNENNFNSNRLKDSLKKQFHIYWKAGNNTTDYVTQLAQEVKVLIVRKSGICTGDTDSE